MSSCWEDYNTCQHRGKNNCWQKNSVVYDVALVQHHVVSNAPS